MSILELSSKEIEKQFDLFSKTSMLDNGLISLLKNMNLIQKKYYTQLEEKFAENYAKKFKKKLQ